MNDDVTLYTFSQSMIIESTTVWTRTIDEREFRGYLGLLLLGLEKITRNVGYAYHMLYNRIE